MIICLHIFEKRKVTKRCLMYCNNCPTRLAFSKTLYKNIYYREVFWPNC